MFHSPIIRAASMVLDGYPAFISPSERVIQHAIHHIITVPSGLCASGVKACCAWGLKISLLC